MYHFKAKYLLLIAVGLILIFQSCGSRSQSSWDSKKYRAAASALFQRELFEESLEMYERYLFSDKIMENDIPLVLYQIGNIYLENLGKPQKALGYYTVLKALYPHKTFDKKLGKKIVSCLEKSGRITDAAQAMSNITDISPQEIDSAGGSRIVAEIGDRKITINEIELSVGALPKAQLEREQSITQYVTQILIADAARRKGLDDKPEFRRKLAFVENQILAQANLQEELDIAQPSENDLKYYYEANKQRYQAGPDSGKGLNELLPKVGKDWQMEKQNEKYQEYVKKLLGSDKVKIYGTSGK